jgi:hypothetical protein
MYEALYWAFRWARKKDQSAVGTAHVLYALVRFNEFNRDATFAWSRLEPIGTLARPLLGFKRPQVGSGWRSTDSTTSPADQHDQEIIATLRESAWNAVHLARSTAPVPPWTDAVKAAVQSAFAEAERVGDRHAHESHLLAGLLADPSNQACELLDRSGFDRTALGREIREDQRFRVDGRPWTPVVPLLTDARAVRTSESWPSRLLPMMFSAMMRSRGSTYRNPILNGVEFESRRHAVRLGHPLTAPVHALLAILSLDKQVAAAGTELVDDEGHNRAGALLRSSGLTYWQALTVAAGSPPPFDRPDPAAEARFGPRHPGDPQWGLETRRIFDAAVVQAGELGHRTTGTSHLLLALLAEREEGTAEVLDRSGVDQAALRARAMSELSDTTHR